MAVETVYVLPRYVEGKGDCTEILMSKGEIILLEKNIETVIKNIIERRLISYSHLVKKAIKITKQRRNFPLCPAQGIKYISIKVREAKTKGDRVYGFVNEKFIKTIYLKNIILTQNNSIKILENEKLVLQRIELAEIVEREFERLGIYPNANEKNELEKIINKMEEMLMEAKEKMQNKSKIYTKVY